MNINHYIALSMTVHLLFFGYFMVSHSGESTPKIFHVNIVDSTEIGPDSDAIPEKSPPEERAVKKEPVPMRKPVIVKRRRMPVDIDNDVKPDVVFGEGLGESQKDQTGTEPKGEIAKQGGDSGQDEKESSPAARDDLRASDSEGPALSQDFLFDKQTIEKYARKGSPHGAGIEDGTGLMFYAPEFKNRAYMRMLRDRIESIWKYPKDAARRQLAGDLYIKFAIRKNGKLESVELVRTSGYRELDEAAIQALKKGDPYWPLPENYEKDILEITGHFIYVLGNTYAM